MARTLRDMALELIDLPGRMALMAWRAQQAASAMAMPNSFIRGIKARRVSDTHWQLVNDWTGANYHTGEMDVPLAKFFEYGTKDHLVLPVYAKALSWTETVDASALPHVPGEGEARVRRFSRGHVVSGLPVSEPMTSSWRTGVSELRAYIESGLAGDLGRRWRGA